MHPFIGLLVCIFIIIVISKYMQQSRQAQIEYMEDNGAYTIGKIIEYSPSTLIGLGGSPQSIDFSYSVQGKEYETRYNDGDYPVPNKDFGPKEGKLFMAIYLPNKPEKCALLFDYPVMDSADYKLYFEAFKIKRPKLGN